MDCRRFEENIAEYILNDPGLSTGDRQEMRSHMAICSKCYEVYDETKWIIELIRENKERVSEVFSRKEREEALEALANMTDEEVAEELANSEPVDIPGLPSVEESWDQLKAKMEAQDEQWHRETRIKRIKWTKQVAAMAASVLVVIGVAFVALNMCTPKGSVALLTDSGARVLAFGQQIQTGTLERKEIRLGNKHSVMANHNTKFTVNQLQRGFRHGYQINLTQGELYVEVEHDGNPFIVTTPNATAVITGTTFNIRAMNSKTDLTLVEGSVNFGSVTSEQSRVDVSTGNTSSVQGNNAPSTPTPTDVQAVVAWARETAIKTAFARKGLSFNESWINEFIDNLPTPEPANPACLDYARWRNEKRAWFQTQFPWIFIIQKHLKNTSNIDANYLDVLIISGDIWQFHYPQPSRTPIPEFTPTAINRIATHYKVNTGNLLNAVSAYGGTQAGTTQMELNLGGRENVAKTYRAALEQWQTDITAAERQHNEQLPNDLLIFSLHATAYLENTRTAAYLWLRKHPGEIDRLLANADYGFFLAGLTPARSTNSQTLLVTLHAQAVASGQANDILLKALISTPNTERLGCSCQAEIDQQLSDTLAPLTIRQDTSRTFGESQ